MAAPNAHAQTPGGQVMAASGSNVYLAWVDDDGVDREILFRRSTDGGATFAPPVNLSQTELASTNVTLHASGARVAVAWIELSAGGDLMIASSDDGGATFGTPVNVSNGPSRIFEYAVALDGANIYAVWQKIVSTSFDDAVLFSASDDGGTTFSTPVTLSGDPTVETTGGVTLAAAGETVHVSWHDAGKVIYSGSADGGESFSEALELGTGNAPQLAATATSVYAVWELTGSLRFRASGDGGEIFASESTLASGGSPHSYQLGASGGRVHLLWRALEGGGHTDVYFRSSDDGGASFDPTLNLSNDTLESNDPRLAFSGTEVLVAWDSRTRLPSSNTYNVDSEILLRRSDNSGDTFGTAVQLGTLSGRSFGHQLALAGGKLHLAWTDTGPGSQDLFYASSTDGGASFDFPLNFTETTGSASASRTVAAGDDVYVTWTSRRPGNADIFLAVSHDGGQTFGAPANLSRTLTPSTSPTLAVSGDDVYVLWVDTSPGNPDVFLRRSTNGGNMFEPAVNLSDDTGNSLAPQVALASGGVHVMWQNDDPDPTFGIFNLMYRRSTDGGVIFSPAAELTGAAGFYNRLAASVDNVYAMWGDEAAGSVLVKRSTDGGEVFESPTTLVSGAGSNVGPAMDVAGSNVYVAWYSSNASSDIIARASDDGGETYGAAINLSNSPGSSFNPSVKAFGGTAFVGWLENTATDAETFLARTTDAGETFGAPINVSDNSGNSFTPMVAGTGSSVYAIWADVTPGVDFDVYLARSTDSGATFRTPLNLSTNASTSIPTGLAVSGSRVYAAWEDTPNLHTDVLMRRSGDSGATLGEPLNLSTPPRPARTVVEETDYRFALPDPSGFEGEPDPDVWTKQGNLDPFPLQSVGLFVSDPDHASSLLYVHETPFLSGDPESPYATNAAVLRVRARAPDVPSSSSAWNGYHLGWRMILDDGAHRVDLTFCRPPPPRTDQFVCDLNSSDFSWIPFGWGNDLFNTYEIRRSSSGDFMITVASGDTACGLCEQSVTVRGGASSGTPMFAWGMATSGGGTAIFAEAHAEVLTNNEPPSAGAGGPYAVDEGETVQLGGSGSDPQGDDVQYRWDLDDNGTFETNGQNPMFDAGDLDGPDAADVTLEVCDEFPLCSTDTATISIANVAPVVGAGPDRTVQAGTPLTFAASFSDAATADTHATSWTFGEGGTASGTLTPTYTYSTAGTYTATLTVTDDDGGAGTDSLQVTVTPPPAPSPQPSPPPSPQGPCTITGTEGNDDLSGTSGDDFICALGGDDVVHASGGKDTILLGAGNDRGFGEGGNDRIVGGKGSDRLFGGAGNDRLEAKDGVRGNDRLSGGPGPRDRCIKDRRDRAVGCP